MADDKLIARFNPSTKTKRVWGGGSDVEDRTYAVMVEDAAGEYIKLTDHATALAEARRNMVEKVQTAIKLIHSDESEGGDYQAGMAILCEVVGYEFPAHKASQTAKPISIYDVMKKAEG